MKDFVPKGTGNSRYLKSVSNFLSLYPRYEDFANALMAGTLPIDLNGINSGGVTQTGTALSKANLLSDTTATALKLTGDPTVNDALYALNNRIPTAVLNVHTKPSVMVRATKGSKNLVSVADSSGLAVFHIEEFGVWTLKATVNGQALAVPFEIDSVAVFDLTVTTDLEDVSWEFIHTKSEAGKATSIWKLGDKKTVNIGGVTYQMQIIGFNHDTKAAGGTAGITFQMVDCMNTTAKMSTASSNSLGWNGSDMRKTTLKEIFTQLPEDLQKVIVPVNKKAYYPSLSVVYSSVDQLFLLCEIEVFGKTTYSSDGEGTQYDWYKAGNSAIKKLNGVTQGWWERSPLWTSSDGFCMVGIDGNPNRTNTGNFASGVSFAFCV